MQGCGRSPEKVGREDQERESERVIFTQRPFERVKENRGVRNRGSCLDRQSLLNSSGRGDDGEPWPAFSPCNSSKDHPAVWIPMRLIQLIDLQSPYKFASLGGFSKSANDHHKCFYTQYINTANISMYRKGTPVGTQGEMRFIAGDVVFKHEH